MGSVNPAGDWDLERPTPLTPWAVPYRQDEGRPYVTTVPNRERVFPPSPEEDWDDLRKLLSCRGQVDVLPSDTSVSQGDDQLHPTVTKFLAVLDEARDLHLRKSRDYGSDGDPYANVRGSEAWGLPAWAGAMLRAGDKVVRLQSYVSTGALANEGVEDSLIDIVVYAAIALALFREGPE